MTALQDLAGTYRNELSLVEHNDDSFFIVLPSAPVAFRDAINTAQSTELPDDIKLSYIADSLEKLRDSADPADGRLALTADTTFGPLTSWISSDSSRLAYLLTATNAVIDVGDPLLDSLVLLSDAQLLERQEIYDSIQTSLEAILA